MTIKKLVETIRVSIEQLTSNTTRTMLTALGVTIGVAAVISLLSLGQGVQSFVVSQFEALGSGTVIVFGTPTDNSTATPGQPNFAAVLSQSDVALLSDARITSKITNYAYTLNISESATYDGNNMDASIRGVSASYMDLLKLEVTSGRGLDETDINGNARVAVVGKDVVTDLFDGKNAISESIRIGDVNFRIVGILGDATSLFVGNDSILIPVSTAQHRLSGGRTQKGDYPLSSIIFSGKNSDVVDSLVDEIKTILRADRGLDIDEVADFSVIAQSSFVDTLTTITSILTIFLGFIASISLFVGGIGIMNIMMVTVTERTREIGLRKAVGAQKGDILLQFLMEAISIALAGGAVGTLIAIVLTSLVSALIPDFSVLVQFSSILFATVISTLVGGFFGVFPANRAANMNPIDALRYE